MGKSEGSFGQGLGLIHLVKQGLDVEVWGKVGEFERICGRGSQRVELVLLVGVVMRLLMGQGLPWSGWFA